MTDWSWTKLKRESVARQARTARGALRVRQNWEAIYNKLWTNCDITKTLCETKLRRNISRECRAIAVRMSQFIRSFAIRSQVVRNYVMMTHVTGPYITSSQTVRGHFLRTRANTAVSHSFTMPLKGKKGKAGGGGGLLPLPIWRKWGQSQGRPCLMRRTRRLPQPASLLQPRRRGKERSQLQLMGTGSTPGGINTKIHWRNLAQSPDLYDN